MGLLVLNNNNTELINNGCFIIYRNHQPSYYNDKLIGLRSINFNNLKSDKLIIKIYCDIINNLVSNPTVLLTTILLPNINNDNRFEGNYNILYNGLNNDNNIIYFQTNNNKSEIRLEFRDENDNLIKLSYGDFLIELVDKDE